MSAYGEHFSYDNFINLILNTLPYRGTFANRADTDQAALCKSCLIRASSVCLWKYDISDPTLVDMTNNFFVLYTNIKHIYMYIINSS